MSGCQCGCQSETVVHWPGDSRPWPHASPTGSYRRDVHARRMASVVPVVKVGRNDPCPCGSGRKAKKCCLVPV